MNTNMVNITALESETNALEDKSKRILRQMEILTASNTALIRSSLYLLKMKESPNALARIAAENQYAVSEGLQGLLGNVELPDLKSLNRSELPQTAPLPRQAAKRA